MFQVDYQVSRVMNSIYYVRKRKIVSLPGLITFTGQSYSVHQSSMEAILLSGWLTRRDWLNMIWSWIGGNITL